MTLALATTEGSSLQTALACLRRARPPGSLNWLSFWSSSADIFLSMVMALLAVLYMTTKLGAAFKGIGTAPSLASFALVNIVYYFMFRASAVRAYYRQLTHWCGYYTDGLVRR